MASPRVLVVDVGSSSVRAIVFEADGTTRHEAREPIAVTTPSAGLVEVDATALGDAVLRLAREAAAIGDIGAVGIANQRATTVVWDAVTGEPIGPGLSWQDLRTVGRCLQLQAEGIRVAPNAMPTKAEWLLAHGSATAPRVGTIDSWVAWLLTSGSCHVTDASNASASGLVDDAVTGYRTDLTDRFGLTAAMLPTIVASSGAVGATTLPGAPVLSGLAGDQQASLLGQGCVHPGQTKITFGTGAMLDTCTGAARAPSHSHGTVPMVAWRSASSTVFLAEALMLSAGSCIAWLVELGVLDSVGAAGPVAASVPDTADVTFVPALQGLATPRWDHGARGTLLGLTRGTTAAHVVRAVLDGIACTAADLVDATEADTGVHIERLRVDGGMTANGPFLQLLADATGRPIEVSPHREATAWGAAMLAGTGAGIWPSTLEMAERWAPSSIITRRVDRTDRDRDRWTEAVDRSRAWIPALSGIQF